MTGFAHILSRVPWDSFGTVTTCLPVARPAVLISESFSFIRQICKIENIRFRNFLFAIRTERGDINHRLHAHVLLCGIKNNSKEHLEYLAHCRRDRKGWRKVGSKSMPVNGITELVPFDSSLDGVGYVLEGLDAHHYEARKFDASTVDDLFVLSDSTWKWLGVETPASVR